MTLVAMDRRSGAFGTLYEQSYGAVYAYAARRVGADLADEIAAETFLIAWRRWEAVPAEPLPWLYGVARNVLLRHHEATRRQTRAREAIGRERRATPDHDVTGDPALWAAWEGLRAADREVLALVAWEELSVAEAARVVGCSAPQFSVRLFRARRRFERLLAGASASSDRKEL